MLSIEDDSKTELELEDKREDELLEMNGCELLWLTVGTEQEKSGLGDVVGFNVESDDELEEELELDDVSILGSTPVVSE